MTAVVTTFDGVIVRYGLQLKRQGYELVGPCPSFNPDDERKGER